MTPCRWLVRLWWAISRTFDVFVRLGTRFETDSHMWAIPRTNFTAYQNWRKKTCQTHRTGGKPRWTVVNVRDNKVDLYEVVKRYFKRYAWLRYVVPECLMDGRQFETCLQASLWNLYTHNRINWIESALNSEHWTCRLYTPQQMCSLFATLTGDGMYWHNRGVQLNAKELSDWTNSRSRSVKGPKKYFYHDEYSETIAKTWPGQRYWGSNM